MILGSAFPLKERGMHFEVNNKSENLWACFEDLNITGVRDYSTRYNLLPVKRRWYLMMIPTVSDCLIE